MEAGARCGRSSGLPQGFGCDLGGNSVRFAFPSRSEACAASTGGNLAEGPPSLSAQYQLLCIPQEPEVWGLPAAGVQGGLQVAAAACT